MRAIIYFSLTGSTKKELESRFAGDYYRIESAKKLPKRLFCQLFLLGFYSSFSIPLKYKPMSIDFDKYDEIVLGTPVWAFTITPIMKHFLKKNKFENKKVSLLITCGGNPKNSLSTFKKLLDPSNEVKEEIVLKLDNVKKNKQV